MYETILFEIEAGVATLTLNRPDKLNSFNTLMHEELRDALKQVETPENAVRCLLITGAGKGFSAGQDLTDRAVEHGEEAPDLGASLEKSYNPLVRKLKALDMPVICAVNGVAAGAGANVALACDIVIASRTACFIQAFCRIGLAPDSGGSWSLPRLVGHARAMAVSMLGDKVSADQAEQWGMIYQAVEPEALMEEASRLAARLAAQPTVALGLLKRALHASATNDFDAQLDLERDLQTIAGRTADYREGVRAFTEKRPPTFEGR